MRSADVAAGVAYAAQAAVLAIALLLTGAAHPLPVVAVFRDGADAASVSISTVDLGWALVALLAGGALAHAASAVRASSPDAAPGAAARVALIAGWSQGAAILVFLIAQLNGIAEVTSLVPLYAITATAVILVGLDDGRAESTWRRQGAWAAVVGIVPWGVIAFAQIGATFTTGGPPLGVRVVTLLGLAVAICGWVIAWRRRGAPLVADVAAMTAGVSVLVWALIGVAAI
jgi:hypothetical protein